MKPAGISPRKQADKSWRGSHQRTSHQPQMQERSALGRLLNATIVVCGACYILYVAVYLGLDLKSVFAKPQHETYKVRLHLHSKPAAWDGQEPLQLHSAASPGAAAKDPSVESPPDGKDQDSDPSRTTEEPVPGVGILASQTKNEPDIDTFSKASAESRSSDTSNTAAPAKQQLTNEADLPDVLFSDSLPADKGVDTSGLKESKDALETPVPGDGMLASMLVSATAAEQAELDLTDASSASAESSDHDTSDDALLADKLPADPIRGTLYEELFTGDHPAINTWMENVGEGRVKEPYIPKGSLSKKEEGSDTKPVTSSKVAEAALSGGKSADADDSSAARDMEHDSLTLDEEEREPQALGLNEEKEEEARKREREALRLDEKEEELEQEELEQDSDGPILEGVKLAAKSAEAGEDAFLASMKDSESRGKQEAHTSMGSNRLAADTDKTAGKAAKTESLMTTLDDPEIVEEGDDLDLPLLSSVGSDRLSADLDKTTGKAAKTKIPLAGSDVLDLGREEDDLLDLPLFDSPAGREDRDVEEDFPILSSIDGEDLQYGDELPDEPLRR